MLIEVVAMVWPFTMFITLTEAEADPVVAFPLSPPLTAETEISFEMEVAPAWVPGAAKMGMARAIAMAIRRMVLRMAVPPSEGSSRFQRDKTSPGGRSVQGTLPTPCGLVVNVHGHDGAVDDRHNVYVSGVGWTGIKVIAAAAA